MILLLLLFAAMLFYKWAIVTIEFSTNTNVMLMEFRWLGSFLKITIKINIIESSPYLSVYIFDKRIVSKTMKKKKGKQKIKWEDRKALVLRDEYANVTYGFNNPFTTGMGCGIIDILQYYFKGIAIVQYPDFLSEQEYITVNAGAQLNIGKTFVNYVRLRSARKGEKEYGSIQLDRKRRRSVS